MQAGQIIAIRMGDRTTEGSRLERSKYRGSAVAFQRCGCLACGQTKRVQRTTDRR